ncbi:hypothetical protein HanOQP8_Chr03g0111191 [Helianthus annuus]|nr:hypothetical protein HanHA89_Chr03g0110351 [Helianthus annuus]KAJ0768647.1 hypothetical protein HanLR1_Chr03g0103731 [Helianthus annuus]KAJ0774391.1 hypothetical protein HanOQP8_Chr03g0111191 [Helianthus annuus]
MHTLQCRTVVKTWRFGPVNLTKTDGFLTGLLTGPKRRALAAFWSCQPDKRLTPGLVDRTKTRPKLGVLVRSTDPSVFCLVDRTKTPHFGHSSTLQGVHIKIKNTFLG